MSVQQLERLLLHETLFQSHLINTLKTTCRVKLSPYGGHAAGCCPSLAKSVARWYITSARDSSICAWPDVVAFRPCMKNRRDLNGRREVHSSMAGNAQ